MYKKLLFIPLLMLIVLMGCSKADQNPEYKFTIITKTVDDSSRVQNILVEVGVPSTVDGVVAFYGYTNTNGEIEFEYDKDAVLRIRATRGNDPYTMIACSYVHLEPNKNVKKTVYLKPYDPTFPGCDLNF